ncbi:MAG TPA: hypothetical protein VLV17_07950 [Anaeromyxobacteraceae bacterium]|nr:hypothetical protein [Anaeromyxobacteraceae bacterium]
MKRNPAKAAAALALTLAACPLPQPLNEFYDGGSVTPPIILTDQVVPQGTLLLAGKNCPSNSGFALQAAVSSVDTTYPVEARWFIDYDPRSNWGIYQDDVIPLTPTETVGSDEFVFVPPPYDGSTALHVVEVVVSNGFAAAGDQSVAQPNRTARSGFETQLYRFVFEYSDSGTCQ